MLTICVDALIKHQPHKIICYNECIKEGGGIKRTDKVLGFRGKKRRRIISVK